LGPLVLLFVVRFLENTTKSNYTDQSTTKWLGMLSYSIALELQHQLVELTQKDINSLVVLGMEHPSVITLGKRANPQEEINVKLELLTDLNIQCYKVDRGGFATLHSPGQLVIYPILKLSNYGLTIKDYLCLLQKTTLEFFNHHNIKAFAKENSPGIYTENGKIAFFGIRVQRGVAFHGLSINVSNETEDFSLIKSCGSSLEKFDKMSSHKITVPLETLYKQWSDIFLYNLGEVT
jgi:lipoate-protein ligase B